MCRSLNAGLEQVIFWSRKAIAALEPEHHGNIMGGPDYETETDFHAESNDEKINSLPLILQLNIV